LGLTNSQWQSFQQDLAPQQLHVLTSMKAGESIETIAKALNLKTNQVISEWSQVYLAAQELRSG
jgi:DNA-binding NarL/FixJ family response regulator